MVVLRGQQHVTILAQIEALDRQNNKLISVADNILKTSSYNPSTKSQLSSCYFWKICGHLSMP